MLIKEKNTKNTNIKRGIIFILIAILIFLFINKISDPSGTYGEWYTSSALKDFYQRDKNTVDMLYVGSSNVYAGISPLEIYEKIGATGYSYSSSEQKVWSSYYLIKEALKTQTPKAIFLETSEFFSDATDQNEQGKRKAIDPLNFSDNKIEMVNDFVYGFSNFDKLSCYVKILRYHSRWTKLNWSDIEKIFNKEYSYEGYIFDNKIKSFYFDENKVKHEEETTPDTSVTEMPSTVKDYLNKIIELCKEKNITLVFISMPTPKTWSQTKHNEIEKVTTENNLKFIDLNTDDALNIDWDNDSSDSGTHLNIYGAEKVGDYLSNYITKNFEITDHREDEKYQKWNKDLERYNEKKGITKTYIDENNNNKKQGK